MLKSSLLSRAIVSASTTTASSVASSSGPSSSHNSSSNSSINSNNHSNTNTSSSSSSIKHHHSNSDADVSSIIQQYHQQHVTSCYAPRNASLYGFVSNFVNVNPTSKKALKAEREWRRRRRGGDGSGGGESSGGSGSSSSNRSSPSPSSPSSSSSSSSFYSASPLAPPMPAPPSSPVHPYYMAKIPPQNTNTSVVRPYPVEGGCVPIYQMANGRIQKRNWVFNTSTWCELCKEPVSLWQNHMGRKDHALLDLHYSAQATYPRSWNPEFLFKFFDEYSPVPFHRYQEQYARFDKERREEIFALIKFLESEKVLHLGDPRQTFLLKMIGGLRGMDHQGALVMHKFLLGPFMRLFPDGGIQDFSNLIDFITCAYNMETVYDLCGFQALDVLAKEGLVKTQASSPAALGLGGLTTGSSSAHGFDSASAAAGGAGGGGAAASPSDASSAALSGAGGGGLLSEQESEEAFSRKAVFIRSLLGQLRWSIVEDQVHPTGKVYPHHILLACELLIKYLMAEIISVRLSEYMVRVEPRWVEFGLERRIVSLKAIAAREVTPQLVQYGYRPMAEDKSDLYSTVEHTGPKYNQQINR